MIDAVFKTRAQPCQPITQLPFVRRGLLRVRAADPAFQQLIRDAEILLATDVRNPRNSCVVYHEPRPHKNDWQDEKTAEVVAVPVDYETDDAEVLGELCKMLKGSSRLDR